MLPKTPFGRTGFSATRLGYGAMEIRGSRIWSGRPVADAEAERILNAVLDAGINFLDTSPDYGRSEEFIGRFLSRRRDEFFLATKCGCQVRRKDDQTDETPHVWTRENVLGNIEESLARMKTDRLDLVQIHNARPEQAAEGRLVEALAEAKRQGKVRFLGASSGLPAIPTFLSWGVFDAFQIPYSALERENEEVIAQARRAGAGTIIRGGVARGEPGRGLGKADRWRPFEEARLAEILPEGETPTTFLLRYTLSHPHADTVIVGTLRPDHLQENVQAALRGPLPPEVYAEARRRLDAAAEKQAVP